MEKLPGQGPNIKPISRKTQGSTVRALLNALLFRPMATIFSDGWKPVAWYCVTTADRRFSPRSNPSLPVQWLDPASRLLGLGEFQPDASARHATQRTEADWPALPDAIKAGILAAIRAAWPRGETSPITARPRCPWPQDNAVPVAGIGSPEEPRGTPDATAGHGWPSHHEVTGNGLAGVPSCFPRSGD